MHWGSIEDGNISSLSIYIFMYLIVEHDTTFNDVSVGKNMEYFSTSIIHDSVSTIKISGKKKSRIPCVVQNRWLDFTGLYVYVIGNLFLHTYNSTVCLTSLHTVHMAELKYLKTH